MSAVGKDFADLMRVFENSPRPLTPAELDAFASDGVLGVRLAASSESGERPPVTMWCPVCGAGEYVHPRQWKKCECGATSFWVD